MSNLSTEHLIKCIIEKDKYKQTQLYIKELQLDNDSVYSFINEALYNIIAINNYSPSAKLYGLRFLKDVFMSAQFHLIDGLHQNIMKHIIKACQFDKQNQDKAKRGSLYFEQVQKRKKENDLEKVSYSYVLFSTEMVYVMGVWHALDQNNQTTDYAVIYEKLKKIKVPFPQNDKDLKFFKLQEREVFQKNYREWIEKLPQIEEESDEGDEKENANQKSRKSIKSKQKITEPDQPKNSQKQKSVSQIPLLAKDQNKTVQKSQSQTKRQQVQSSKVSKPIIDESEIKRLKELNESKDKQIATMQAKIEGFSKKNKEFEQKIAELEVALKTAKNSTSAQSRAEDQKSKIRFTTLQNKCSTLETKCLALQKEGIHLKSKLEESQSLRQRQVIQCQQLKNLLKKAQTQKTQMEQKLKTVLEESKTQLKEARQKITRLERQIQQLNTIKKSYKTIIQESHPQENFNKEKESSKVQIQQKIKIQQLQTKIQETVKFYTKQTIQLKSQVSELKSNNEDLQKYNQTKESQIQSLNLKIQQKTNKISQLQSDIQNLKSQTQKLTNQSFITKQKPSLDQSQNQLQITVTVKRQDPLTIDLNNIKPQLKRQTQQKKQNSMSDYLLSHTTTPKYQPLTLQKTKLQSSFQNAQISLVEKVKNKSLGKTEKSQEKSRQKKQRYSAGKTFHSTNYDQRSIQQSVQMNSNRLSQINMAMKKAQSSSYGNLWKPVSRAQTYLKHDNQSSISKKTSALYLERKPYFYDLQTPKPNAIQTVIPFIDNYFSQKLNISHQDTTIFKSLCLSSFVRQRQPIFVDHNIQVKLLQNSSGSKDIFVLQVMNTGYSSIKVKAVSCHDQFKIFGEKSRFIHSNSAVEYRIQTRNKDLNIRYPIVSLIVTQDEGNRTKNIVYNVPLPLTLLEFTEMKNEIPNFYEPDSSKIKVFKSDTFLLNPRFDSLRQSFPQLSLTQKGKSTKMESRQTELSWQGNLHHSFIENVDTFFKISQVGNQVTLEFAVRDYDIVSENYSKAMIQTLMFLLQ